MKVQLNCFDISGNVYKQRIYKDQIQAYKGHKRLCKAYGGYLRFTTQEVPLTQKTPLPVASIGSAYCFCPDTGLHVDKCPRCGKSPYTD